MTTLPITQSFASYLTDERHFSPYTARCYGADLRQFIEYLVDEAGQPIDQANEELAFKARTDSNAIQMVKGSTLTQTICEADADLIRAYLGFLGEQNYSPATMARKIATLRSFYKWGHRNGFATINPMTLIRTPRQSKRLPKAITVEQVERLLSAPTEHDVLGRRDRAMLETLYSTGIRVSELVGINYNDMDIENEPTATNHSRSSSTSTARDSHHARSVVNSTSTSAWSAWIRPSRRTPCVTRLRPTCLRTARTSALSKNSLDTSRSQRPRSTPISRLHESKKRTTTRILAPKPDEQKTSLIDYQ